MYQYILVGIFLSSYSQASANDIKKIYSVYKEARIKFYTSDVNKKNIKSKVADYLKVLNTSLQEIQNIESKTKTPILSPEGNQIAYDQALFEPIHNLSKSKIDKKTCDEAEHLNKINAANDQKEYDMVNSILKKLCK